MTRMELALALGAAVLVAAAVGWGLHMVWTRVRSKHRANPEKLAALSAHIAEIEEARDAERMSAASTEAALREELVETQSRLTRELAERQAELEATMETVGELRRRLDGAH